jgi:hypothetical protein
MAVVTYFASLLIGINRRWYILNADRLIRNSLDFLV